LVLTVLRLGRIPFALDKLLRIYEAKILDHKHVMMMMIMMIIIIIIIIINLNINTLE